MIELCSLEKMRARSRDWESMSLNRMPDIFEWQVGTRFMDILWELRSPSGVHRKTWEYGLCVRGLERLGKITPDSVAIAVGAGFETPLFHFANKIQTMVATDLYDNPSHEGRPEMLTHPEEFSPFPYRKEHLVVQRMSGTDLEYDDNTFDFCFCLSSIEHFGSRDNQRKAFNEMGRVLKNGGVACIITELIIEGKDHFEYFSLDELKDMFFTHRELRLVGGAPDFTVSADAVRYASNISDAVECRTSPHLIMDDGDRKWTSFSMFFEKRS